MEAAADAIEQADPGEVFVEKDQSLCTAAALFIRRLRAVAEAVGKK